MANDQPLTARQFKKSLAALRKDLHRLAAAVARGQHQVNQQFNRLIDQNRRKFSVIEIGGKRYRFYK
jgi:hypothetical protein